MTRQRTIRATFLLILITAVGLSLAFTLTSLARASGIRQIQALNPAAKIYYVSKNGIGSDGLSWLTAFTDVQQALNETVSGDEIWVASGIYTPGVKQTYSFILEPGVGVYGGFAATETTRTQRDWVNNLTILSADIAGDDITDSSGIVSDTDNLVGNNNYHVVYAIGVFSDTVLDGFSITSGKADGGTDFYKVGGGLFCNGTGVGGNCNPTLKNLVFSGNLAATKGGGIYNNATFQGNSSPRMTNVTFSGNKSLQSGGAIYNDGDQGTNSPVLEDVKFLRNSADNGGGAVYNNSGNGNISSYLKNVVVSGNSAGVAGGAIYYLNSNGTISNTLINIVFSGNSAGVAGGAIYHNGIISHTLTNGTFSGNRADLSGGALYNNNSGNLEIRNTIIWNNQDRSGVGTIDASIQNTGNSTTTLKNSLVQGTGGSGSWTSDISYVDGGGNKDVNPLFIEPISPTTAPTTTGNLRLQEISPAIDAGDNMYISGVPYDLDGLQRIVDGNSDGTPTVDMGAFELQIDYGYGVYIPLILH